MLLAAIILVAIACTGLAVSTVAAGASLFFGVDPDGWPRVPYYGGLIILGVACVGIVGLTVARWVIS